MKGLKDVRMYVEGSGIITGDVGFENGKIAAIGEGLDIDPIFDLPARCVLVPGFIDEHIHGAAGSDAMDGSVEALSTISGALAKEGTVGFLATTMTQSPENISKAMRAVREYRSTCHPEGAELLGIHLEGPFISKKHVGAQPIEYVVSPNVETFARYNEQSGGSIKIVTLAPEVEGAEELIEYLRENRIVASIGHTDAGYEDVERAIEWGATNITHTYNAQKGIHHRQAGTVGAAFLFDEVNCEMICDLIHVSAPAIRLCIKNKPHDKFTLITDAMRAKAMPDGKSELGGQEVFVKNGEARLADGTLAGSVLKMNVAIKNLVTKCGVSFTDAIDFATVNPAKNLSVYDRLGSIKVGKDASLTALDGGFEVVLTLKNGGIIYKA